MWTGSKRHFCHLISGVFSVALKFLGWQACGQWQCTAVNELIQPLVNTTLCRHKRKEAKDARDEGNPTVKQCGSAASCWSKKGSKVHPRRVEGRHTSVWGAVEVEGVWIYAGESKRCSSCRRHLVSLVSSILPIVESLTAVMGLCTACCHID